MNQPWSHRILVGMDFENLAADLVERIAPKVPGRRRDNARVDLYSVMERHGPYSGFRHGYPNPAASIRSLKSVAEGWGTASALVNLLRRWEKLSLYPYRQLPGFAARELDFHTMEKRMVDGSADRHLLEVAEHDPGHVRMWAGEAAEGLAPQTRAGRGGPKNRGKLVERDLVLELGLIFERLTGEHPGVTTNPVDDSQEGRFVDLVCSVASALDVEMTPLTVKRFLADIKKSDIPRWKKPVQQVR
ncbi:MAG: hypothetical protein R3D34_15855 [Nitratireductor sp.]